MTLYYSWIVIDLPLLSMPFQKFYLFYIGLQKSIPFLWSITMIYVLTIPCSSSMARRYGSFWRILKFLFTRCSSNAGSKDWSIFSWAISCTWARFSITTGARGISSLIVIVIRYNKNLGVVTSSSIRYNYYFKYIQNMHLELYLNSHITLPTTVSNSCATYFRVMPIMPKSFIIVWRGIFFLRWHKTHYTLISQRSDKTAEWFDLNS